MKLNQSEMSLMEIIWENEPMRSGELVSAAGEKLGWKKSTVYTVLKHLTEKGAAANENAVVSSIAAKEAILAEQSDRIVDGSFGGSLPMFVTAFLNSRKISKKEAEELKKLIDSYTEE